METVANEERRDEGASRVPGGDAPSARHPRLVAVLGAVGVAASVVAAVLVVPAVTRVGVEGAYATDLLIGASFTVLGVLVTRRQPENRIGWLFLAIGVIEAVVAAANHLAIVGLAGGEEPAWAVWAGWIGYWSVSLVVPTGLFLTLLIVFPTGRPLSRMWGWVAIAGIGFSVFFAVSEILFLARMDVTTEIVIDNPVNIGNSTVAESVWVVGLAILLLGVASVVVRFRRSSDVERQQLRWFLFAVTLGIGTMAFVVLTYFLMGAPEPEPDWFIAAVTIIPLLGIGIGVPVACGVAILRYRLWDLDVVIRKAVVVALVTGAITVLYIAIVGGVGALLGSRLDTSVTFVAAAVMAVAFQPIRHRANRLADRLVYGRRATPYEVLSDFSERVGEAYAADDVLPRMAQILGEGTGATFATVWLHVGGELRAAASWPAGRAAASVRAPGDGLPELGEPAFEVRHRGELLGALSVSMPPSDPMDPTKERLVRDLAAQAGLALRNVRLIEELRASRQRLVAAQDEERRKLERNLHDGAQQQLVALAVKTRLASALVGRDEEKERQMLAEVQEGLGDSLETLRDLARGIYPPLLADKGLGVALESQARKAAVPVTVDADGIGRYPQETEAAVYFCTLEALNNIAKYAEAGSVRVVLAERDGGVTFRVVDDGKGFDPAVTGYGTGLQGMADRLEAVGGTLDVQSRPGAGTTVIGSVPARG